MCRCGAPRSRSAERDFALVLVEPGVERLEIGVELPYQVEVPDSGEVFGRVGIELVHVGDFQGARLPGRPHLVVSERPVDDLLAEHRGELRGDSSPVIGRPR
jgi:hypothetical protein